MSHGDADALMKSGEDYHTINCVLLLLTIKNTLRRKAVPPVLRTSGKFHNDKRGMNMTDALPTTQAPQGSEQAKPAQFAIIMLGSLNVRKFHFMDDFLDAVKRFQEQELPYLPLKHHAGVNCYVLMEEAR